MSTASERKVGRPRASRRASALPPEEEILKAAAKLVARKGFKGTSTREIADAAGLRQPSIFHYFENKEAIYRELLERSIQPVLDFVKANDALDLSAPEKLYRLIYFDTWYLTTGAYCGTAAAVLADDIKAAHPGFKAKRNRLIAAYGRLIEAGAADGTFAVGDVAATTNAIFGLGEGSMWWAASSSPARAAEIAETNADLGLRALLADGGLLPVIRSAALSIDIV